MTAEDFRRIALRLPQAVEHAHMDHPDFRVRGKIFATLGYPDDKSGMVKLTPEQQHDFVKSEPNVFAPSSGAWGRRGSTIVNLKLAKKTTVQTALAAAWRNVAPQSILSNPAP